MGRIVVAASIENWHGTVVPHRDRCVGRCGRGLSDAADSLARSVVVLASHLRAAAAPSMLLPTASATELPRAKVSNRNHFNLAAALTELRGFDGLLAGRRVHAVGRSVARSLRSHSWSFSLWLASRSLRSRPMVDSASFFASSSVAPCERSSVRRCS